MDRIFRVFPCTLLKALAIGAIAAGSQAAVAQVGAGKAPVAASASVLRIGPTLKPGAILARPDTDLVELSDGRRMRVGDLRRLTATAQRMRSATGNRLPAALKVQPAATGRRVADAKDLAEALKRPDSETVVLPSGRRATVAQLRFVQPYVEKRLGHKLGVATVKRPDLSGSAIKVSAASDFKDILQRPAATVLESPDGTRITVGELKQALAGDGKPAARR